MLCFIQLFIYFHRYFYLICRWSSPVFSRSFVLLINFFPAHTHTQALWASARLDLRSTRRRSSAASSSTSLLLVSKAIRTNAMKPLFKKKKKTCVSLSLSLSLVVVVFLGLYVFVSLSLSLVLSVAILFVSLFFYSLLQMFSVRCKLTFRLLIEPSNFIKTCSCIFKPSQSFPPDCFLRSFRFFSSNHVI